MAREFLEREDQARVAEPGETLRGEKTREQQREKPAVRLQPEEAAGQHHHQQAALQQPLHTATGRLASGSSGKPRASRSASQASAT